MKIDQDIFLPFKFKCNICCQDTVIEPVKLHREISSCSHCGSIPRTRGLLMALSQQLFDKTLCIQEFSENRNIKGIGMSEHPVYADVLSSKFTFTNTFYHTTPFLDITSTSQLPFANLDFIISTEVFEHIKLPLDVAFSNLYSMLKPGGKVIFSAPYSDNAKTIEHYPELDDYECIELSTGWIVVNRTKSGKFQVFEKPVFHGGPGAVLEMRVFSESDLIEYFTDAGFVDVKVYNNADLSVGYFWRREIGSAYVMSATKRS